MLTIGRYGFALAVLLAPLPALAQAPQQISAESRALQDMLQEQMQARIMWQIRAIEAQKRADDLQTKLSAVAKPEEHKP